MNTNRIRLGHESLDVTLAYLKGKDVESEEAQEHASLAFLHNLHVRSPGANIADLCPVTALLGILGMHGCRREEAVINRS